MRFFDLLPGTQVLHPKFGLGDVKNLAEKQVEILFNEGRKTFSPEGVGELKLSSPRVLIEGLDKPLEEVVKSMLETMIKQLDLRIDIVADSPGLAPRWVGGKLVLHPNDPTLVTKEVPLEVFFRKIVLVRDYLRVLEAKINAHPKLNDAERIELEYYITKCYGSFSTFNLLFKERADSFKG